MVGDSEETMPSGVDEHVGWFDRFAAGATRFASRGWFFAGCVALVIAWVPTLFILDFDTSQLLINTATTIVTFLLVALIQNSQYRADQAVQHKLNAMALGLSRVMIAMADEPSMRPATADKLRRGIGELRAAVGLEQRESTS